MAEIKNLKKAVKRIHQALDNKERIILYGDADLDGATSLIILEETIKSLGDDVFLCYFPDREKEGYGLNEKALAYLREKNQNKRALLILLDCGIGNFKEIEMAENLGFEVLVVDHHEIIEGKLPPASLIVDPKQKGDKYPFKLFATCGIAFRMAETALKNRMAENLKQGFLELVALGTIADMMPQEEDNEILVRGGLRSLLFSLRPAFQAFLEFFEEKKPLSAQEFAQKIISILQITENKNHLTETYLILTSDTKEKALKLIKEAAQKNKLRLELLKELTQEISEKLKNDSSPICFEGGDYIPLSIAGPLATRICKKFQKPAFIFSSNKKVSRGSVRVPKGINSIKALEACADLFETYGGHPSASGFRIKNNHLQEFKQRLIEYFSKNQDTK